MDKIFINSAFTKAVDDYTKSNDNVQGVLYNSFLVVVIRSLISIYSELDIINPIVINDEELLKDNLSKFGYDRTNVEIFLSNLQLYYEFEVINERSDIKRKNPYFLLIEKELISMLICKKINFFITENELKVFYDLLYTPYSNNPLRVSYNYLMSDDVLEIDRYFKEEMRSNLKVVVPKEKHLLSSRAYEILNYNIADVREMSESEINRINGMVYDFFKIRENAINKEFLLEKAIMDYEKEKGHITSGNGYVDILLVLSVIVTILMVIGIVTFIII